jgi:hypothetical protein
MADENINELGSLSAQYESGRAGSAAIGWDNRGKLSLGKYQIAYGVGTLRTFLNFCRGEYPKLYNALNPLYSTISQGPESKQGPFAQKWKELAKEGKVQKAEHHFIKATHFDAAFEMLRSEIKVFVAAHMALQQVLWSTAVQHGPAGAKRVLHQAWEEDNIKPARFIRRIYYFRSRRLGGLSSGVKRAVLNRFKDEEIRALQMLEEQ